MEEYSLYNQFSGAPMRFRSNDIKPIIPRRKAKVAWEDEIVIGRKGNYFSVAAVRVLEPTAEYPNLAISFSLSNGRDYTYSQISKEEFANLVQKIQEWQVKVVGIVDRLQPIADQFQAQRDQYLKGLELLSQMNGQDHQGSPDLFDQYGNPINRGGY